MWVGVVSLVPNQRTFHVVTLTTPLSIVFSQFLVGRPVLQKWFVVGLSFQDVFVMPPY